MVKNGTSKTGETSKRATSTRSKARSKTQLQGREISTSKRAALTLSETRSKTRLQRRERLQREQLQCGRKRGQKRNFKDWRDFEESNFNMVKNVTSKSRVTSKRATSTRSKTRSKMWLQRRQRLQRDQLQRCQKRGFKDGRDFKETNFNVDKNATSKTGETSKRATSTL